MPVHRPLLSELSTDELSGKAQTYREMAAGAATPWTRDSLNRIAAALELMVKTRQELAQASTEIPPVPHC
jgi:hypothetical protein